MMLADPTLDDLKVIYSGVPNQVPVENYPFGIVVTTEDEQAKTLTGNMEVTAYSGTIAVNVRGRDLPRPVDRKADVVSYYDVAGFVWAIKRLFRKQENRGLGNLVDPDGAWAVHEIFIGDGGATVYGYAEQEDRPNNYENYGIVPYIVTVQEANDA